MNAYELADELQDLHGLYCEDAANMLRQQADRIAELEKYEPNVKFEDGVYRFNLPNGDEFVIVPPQLKELSDEEIAVLKEIIRISDRKHPLWDKAKEFLK